MLGDGRFLGIQGNFVAQTSERTGITNPVTGQQVWATMEQGTADGNFNEFQGETTHRIANVWRMSTEIDGCTYTGMGTSRNQAFERLTAELVHYLIDGIPF